jgi:acyl dehydratase
LTGAAGGAYLARREDAMAEHFHSEYDVFVGRDMGGNQYRVTPEMICLYEDGTEDRNQWYRGPSPFDGAVGPALLFHSEVYKNLSWYLPNIIGNLHAKQEWELFYPMMVGGIVRTRSTVVERYRKRHREYVVNEMVITGADGRWLQRSRTHQSFLMEQSQAGPVVDKEREKQPERIFVAGEAFGPELPGLEKTITIEMCQAFSGPHRSYHTDREMAQAMGFPDIVVQGMMSVCFLSELMTRSFGAGWFCGGKLSVNLVNVVWPNDRLGVRGQVRGEVPEGSKTRVHVDIWCAKPDGVKTIVGTASALR